MKVSVIYESVEGQTKRIVRFIEEEIRASGYDVKVLNTSDKLKNISFEGTDRIILAAPVHERRHPEGFEMFVSACHDALDQYPTLMISVSLKASYEEGLEEAEDFLTEMKMRTGLRPQKELLVAGAVRSSSYGYYEAQIVNHVVLEGRPVELLDGVHEFTDWDTLKAEVKAFLASTPVKGA